MFFLKPNSGDDDEETERRRERQSGREWVGLHLTAFALKTVAATAADAAAGEKRGKSCARLEMLASQERQMEP